MRKNKIYKSIVKERLMILVGATYDLAFIKQNKRKLLNANEEVLRTKLTKLKEELGKLRAERAATKKNKAMMPKRKKKLEKLEKEVNKIGGRNGEIEEIVQAKMMKQKAQDKINDARLYYEIAKKFGKDILKNIKE